MKKCEQCIYSGNQNSHPHMHWGRIFILCVFSNVFHWSYQLSYTAFSNVSLTCLPERMHLSSFFQFAFSNVSLNGLSEKRHSHVGCICLTFLHYAFSNVAPNCLLERIQNHSGFICLIFLHCVFSNVFSNCLH